MSPTSYQTAPPRALIITTTPCRVKLQPNRKSLVSAFSDSKNNRRLGLTGLGTTLIDSCRYSTGHKHQPNLPTPTGPLLLSSTPQLKPQHLAHVSHCAPRHIVVTVYSRVLRHFDAHHPSVMSAQRLYVHLAWEHLQPAIFAIHLTRVIFRAPGAHSSG